MVHVRPAIVIELQMTCFRAIAIAEMLVAVVVF